MELNVPGHRPPTGAARPSLVQFMFKDAPDALDSVPVGLGDPGRLDTLV